MLSALDDRRLHCESDRSGLYDLTLIATLTESVPSYLSRKCPDFTRMDHDRVQIISVMKVKAPFCIGVNAVACAQFHLV